METRKRPYRMSHRAASARRTAERILEASLARFSDRPFDEVTLQDVAEDAGVTVQTILRRFGSKQGLMAATGDLGLQRVREERGVTAEGDVADALDNLAEHYERWGDRVLRLLAQEERVPEIRQVTDQGRQLHAEWAERTFGAVDLRRDMLIAVTDVYVWKVLRRDRGLGEAEYREAVGRLVRAVLA